MKISDRDKKIIVILAIACIIALPILFVIKPCKEKTDDLNNDIKTLTERFNYLYDLNQQRPFFESEITRLNGEKANIISSYAKGLSTENTIMFLRNIELTFPVLMTSETYDVYTETPISAGTVNEAGEVEGDYTAVSTRTNVSFMCEYEQLKQLLNYVFSNPEKMTISAINLDFDEETGIIDGDFIFDEYAIIGSGREMAPVVVPSMPHGNESIFAYKLPVVDEEDMVPSEDEEEVENEEEE